MKKYILIILISLFTSFGVVTFNYIDGYCADVALTMGNSASETLNAIGGAFGNLFDVGVGFDPVSLTIGLSNAYDNINASLYNRYGWDLEDGLNYYQQNASALDSGVLNALARTIGGFTDYATAQAEGYALVLSSDAFKHYVFGKVDSANNEITDVVDNALVYVDDNVLTKLSSTKTDLLLDGKLISLSDAKAFYCNHFNFSTAWDFANYNIKFDREFLLYKTYNGNSNGGYYVGIIFPSSYVLSDHFVSGFGYGTSGTLYNFNGVSLDSTSTVVINGIPYSYGTLNVTYGSHSVSSVSANVPPYLDLQDAIDFLQSNNLYDDAIALSYDNDSSYIAQIQAILDSLKGHWVTTDQLEDIWDLVSDLAIDTVVEDGESIPVVDWTTDAIDAITDAIEAIIENNDVIDDSLGGVVDPGPSPIYDNQGIAVIPDFPIPVINNLKSVLTLPLHVFSIFQPLFRVFGVYFSSLWGLWLFVPSCVLIGFLIWLIK